MRLGDFALLAIMGAILIAVVGAAVVVYLAVGYLGWTVAGFVDAPLWGRVLLAIAIFAIVMGVISR